MIQLKTTRIEKKINYDSLSKRVFAGEVSHFMGSNIPLIHSARQLCCEVFECDNPTIAHRLYGKDEFLLRAKAAQETFNTPPYRLLFIDWIQSLGIQPNDLYWDTLGLRIAPPVATHKGGFRSLTQAHRDTWGTAIQTQINWWAPIYPLANGRTMQFYPEYWQQPLSNTTGEWSFQEFLAHRQQTKAQGKAATYPSVPYATKKPSTPSHLVRIKCHDMIAFAAAQLHASVPNRTSLTRFSLEIRTVHPKQKRGAPNCDCLSSPPLYRLFRSCINHDKKLSENKSLSF